MDGSRRSRPDHWLLVAVVALLTVVAAACSTTSETSTAGADFVQHTPPTDSGDAAAGNTVGDDDPLVKLPSDDGRDGDKSFGATMPGSAVLAAALAQADEQSYSFDMGMEVRSAMMGMQMVIAPAGPIMSGSVSGDRMHAVMDMGGFMAGTTVTDENGEMMPMLDLDEFGDLRFEMWLDGTVMTIDMSAMAAMDPSVTGPAAEGPVSFDLAQIDGVDVDDIAAELLGGQQSMDPATAAELLRNLESVVQVGSDEVAGRAVTVYRGTLSMADYSEAMGEDASALGGDLFGMGEMAAMGAALENMSVELTVMIDDDDLLRRMEVFVDIGPLMQTMFAAEPLTGDLPTDGDLGEFGEALEDAMMSLFSELTMTMDMWMEFDGYGESVVSTPPPAVNLTDDFDSLFEGIAA